MKCDYVLPRDGTHVTKDVGEAHLMFVLIKNVHFVGKKLFMLIQKIHGKDNF
jgi:hypothetical protein